MTRFPRGGRGLDKRQRHVLMCTLTTNALLFYDQTAVTVALPDLQREFDASSTELQWTITSYLLALATFMVLAGRLADWFGRKRMLLSGLMLFGLGSAACAFAPSLPALAVFRFVQGIGGAIMQPLALGITARAVAGRDRGWAVGLLSTGGTTLLTLGPVLAGVIVDAASWRWLFLVTLPVVAYSGYQGVRWLTPSTGPERSHVERNGPLLLIIGLATGVTGISQLTDWGWLGVVLIVVGAGILGLFVQRERRAANPLVPLRMVGRNRSMGAALVALFTIQFAVLGTSVYLMLFLQHGMGETATIAGLVLALAGVFTPLLSIATGHRTDRHGPRALMTGGLVLAGCGLGWVGFVAHRHELALLIPGLLAFSLARPAVFTPASASAFNTVRASDRGVASGLVTEARQVGGLLGVAVLGAVLAGVRGTGLTDTTTLAAGFSATMLVTAAILLVGAVVVFVVTRRET